MSQLSLLGGGSVEYVHGIDVFRKGIDGQGPYYDVEYFIDDWSQSDAFANTLVGAGGLGVEPHRHPLSMNLVCVEAHAEGLGKPILNAAGLPEYESGRVRARYRSPSIGGVGFASAIDDPGWVHQVDPTDPILWCTIEMSDSVEILTMPESSYVWASDSSPVGTPIQVEIDLLVLTLTFHRVRRLPVNTLRQYRRKINDGVFWGAADETVLLQNYRTRLQVNSDGQAQRDCVLVFVEREHSWNKLLRNSSMPTNMFAWDYPQDSSGNRRFQKANLRNLLAAFQ